MNVKEVRELIEHGDFPENSQQPELYETHISWVILCDLYVYKIKKPIIYSFLDFSTLEKRKYYCDREVMLNRRLTKDMYINVVSICKTKETFKVADSIQENGIDYAVKMKRIESQYRMDKMLKEGSVSNRHINQLAQILSDFHQKTDKIFNSDPQIIQQNFNDIQSHKDFLSAFFGEKIKVRIENAVRISNSFLNTYEQYLKERAKNGFVVDGHGDLHSRNIFLTQYPQVFDCIEFNDEIRHVDILNELAFLCMDLEMMGHLELSNFFMKQYNQLYDVMKGDEDQELFVYFKASRANIRAKVNALRAKSAVGEEKEHAFKEFLKYWKLTESYLELIE